MDLKRNAYEKLLEWKNDGSHSTLPLYLLERYRF